MPAASRDTPRFFPGTLRGLVPQGPCEESMVETGPQVVHQVRASFSKTHKALEDLWGAAFAKSWRVSDSETVSLLKKILSVVTRPTQGPGGSSRAPLNPPPLSTTHPSEPGLEGVLSEDREETEATDRGRDEEGIVKDRTMDRGRLPRLSSRLEGCGETEGRSGRGWLGVCPDTSCLAWSDPGTLGLSGLASRPKLPMPLWAARMYSCSKGKMKTMMIWVFFSFF